MVVIYSTSSLTTNLDNVTGGAGDDTIIGNSATGVQTLGALDSVDGGEGTDSLSVTATADIASISPAGSTIKNVENITLISNGSVTASSAAATGATKLIATSGDEFALTAAVTTDVIATSSDLAADNASVSGGKDITVTVSKGAAGALSIGSATTAGAIAVDATYTAAATGGAVTLAGGTSITADLKAGNAVNTTSTFGAIGATGGAATTEISISQTAAATASATKVGVANGAVTVADANAGSATKAGTLTTVTLSSYANSTIDSGALTDVFLSGTGGTLGVTAGALTVPAVSALNIHANAAAVGAITADVDYKTITIDSSTKASTIANVTASGATAVNVTGDAKLTLTDNTFAAAKAIVVTNTAGVTFGTTALLAGATFTGGEGDDTVTAPNALTKAIELGDGNDTLTYGGAVGTGGSVNGGDGVDTLVMTDAQAAAADGNAVLNATFTGFEALAISDAFAEDNLNMLGLSNMTSVSLISGVTGTAAIDNLVSGSTVQLRADGASTPDLSVNVSAAAFSSSDELNLSLFKTGAVLAAGSITAANVETINIAAPDASTTASAAVTHTATLVATAAKTVTVAGNNGLTLTNTGNTKITSFDAQGVVANSTTAAVDTAANLAVTFASANNTATASVTITGGAGNDVLTGNAAKDTIDGGAGADIIAGGLGVDSLIVGTGRDIVRFNSNSDATGTVIDSTTAAADTVTGFTLMGAVAAADIDSTAKHVAGTATLGGANATMLSLDLTGDDAGVGAGTNLAVAVESNGTGAGQAAGVTYTVKNGILTLAGGGAASVDTLAEWLTEAAAVAATDGEALAFEYNSNTYVFAQNSTQDTLVNLVGVTDATSLTLASGSVTAAAGGILLGDGL